MAEAGFEPQDVAGLRSWIDGYVRAWNSNDPKDIEGLFADDAAYYPEPFSEPWRGRAEIVAGWLSRKDEPGETQFAWQPLALLPDIAVVQGTTRYANPPRMYSNLWLIRLDGDGRCREFTEWWMEHPR